MTGFSRRLSDDSRSAPPGGSATSFPEAFLVVRVRGRDPKAVQIAAEDIALVFGVNKVRFSTTHAARDDPEFYLRYVNVYKEDQAQR